MVTRRLVLSSAILPLLASPLAAKPRLPTLATALSIDAVTNGVTTTRDGRIFLVLPRFDGSTGPGVVEWIDRTPLPYPAGWNEWTPDKPPGSGFVHVNAVRIGPEGDLWAVDVGAPGLGNPKLRGGPKLVRIDLAANTVRRIYDLDAVTTDKSFVDDVRFNGRHAYLTDAGAPGLIVLDLESGTGRRVLDGDPSTIALRPVQGEGRPLTGPDGKPIYVHADQLEVSPDGRWLHYQPSCGPLYRIETRWLDDDSIDDSERARHVELFAETPPTGGTAIDAAGNLYVSDTDRPRVLRITPERTISTLVEDPRLLWVDAMWIDQAGDLWMPAAQLNRMAPFQGGTSKVDFPVHVYKLQIGQRPARNDHL